MKPHHKSTLIVLAALAVVGCGKTGSTIKGTVTYQDKPLDYGSVVFTVDTRLVQAQIQPDGTFIAEGVPRGLAKIEVHSRVAERRPPPSERKGFKDKAPQKRDPAGGPKGAVIPEIYNDRETSGLTLLVDTDLMEFNIQLKEAAGQISHAPPD